MTTTGREVRGGYRGYGVRVRPSLGARTPLSGPVPEIVAEWIAWAHRQLQQPFVGVTTDGTPIEGLFSLRPTGVSTRPIKDAADALLAALSDDQRATVRYDVDAPEWRHWFNPEFNAMRHGVLIETLDAGQREIALGLLRASLSARGYQSARDAMRLNETLREITGDSNGLGEWLYFLSIFGTPSMTEPWGWQIDGHHLIVNCLVIGDQVVMTPTFLGAEPIVADSGKYAGTRMFDLEQEKGLAMMRSLSPAQQAQATLFPSMLRRDMPPERSHFADWRTQIGAFRDNQIIPYEGIRASELSSDQRASLVDLLALHVGLIRDGHAQVKMEEVVRHLDETYFAWIGTCHDDVKPFYYKVHSPVIIAEFDQHPGIFLDNDEAERFHSHLVIRTPNGNDYGKDLLRQHHARFDHSEGRHVAR
jgi:hypothetical protein